MSGRNKNNFSKVKYEERMAQEMNSFLRTAFNDPRLNFISITHVELNKDYSVAKVFWDTFDSSKRGDAKAAIEGIAGKMRSLLTGVMKVRHIPEIKFHYDSQYEDEHKITTLLNSNDSDSTEEE